MTNSAQLGASIPTRSPFETPNAFKAPENCFLIQGKCSCYYRQLSQSYQGTLTTPLSEYREPDKRRMVLVKV